MGETKTYVAVKTINKGLDLIKPGQEFMIEEIHGKQLVKGGAAITKAAYAKHQKALAEVEAVLKKAAENKEVAEAEAKKITEGSSDAPSNEPPKNPTSPQR